MFQIYLSIARGNLEKSPYASISGNNEYLDKIHTKPIKLSLNCFSLDPNGEPTHQHHRLCHATSLAKKNKITSIFYGNTTTHFKVINLPQLNKIIINLNCVQMKVYLKTPTLKTEIN